MAVDEIIAKIKHEVDYLLEEDGTPTTQRVRNILDLLATASPPLTSAVITAAIESLEPHRVAELRWSENHKKKRILAIGNATLNKLRWHPIACKDLGRQYFKLKDTPVGAIIYEIVWDAHSQQIMMKLGHRKYPPVKSGDKFDEITLEIADNA